MEKSVLELMAAISPEEWTQVPQSGLKLSEELVRRMDRLEQGMAQQQTENERLKEQIARTSANSSQPPSKNPQGFKPNRKEPRWTNWAFRIRTETLSPGNVSRSNQSLPHKM